MEYKKIDNKYVIRFDKGEEIVESLKEFAKNNNIKLANINAIGATSKVKVGLFNTDEKKYYSKEFTGNFEITSLMGTVTTMNDETYLHLHINFSDDNFMTYGGHLNYCYVSATCEMVLGELDGNIDRQFDEEIGINLFKF